MYRMSAFLAGLLAIAYVSGCAPAGEKRDPEFQARKLEQERDMLRQQVTSEQAKNVALQKRLETQDEDLKTTRAQVAALNDHLEKINKDYADVQAKLKALDTRELKRPTISASPLPGAADQALQNLAAKFGDRLWYERGRGAVSFANDRLFDSGSDVVRTDAQAALYDLAHVLAEPDLAEYEVIVVGHTDSAPITKPETLAQHSSNWHLSVHRAIAVKDVLVKGGLPVGRLGVMGYADNRPVGDNPAQNRRVEVFVVRKGGVQPFEPIVPGAKRR